MGSVKRMILSNILQRSYASDVRPFNEIPSPKAYPVIGHAYLFFPNGPYHPHQLTDAIADLSRKLGPIFLLKLPPHDMVFTTNSENKCKLVANEGKWPRRILFPAYMKYQKDTFGALGVITNSDANWHKLRKPLIPLMKKSFVSKFIPQIEEIASDFVRYIRTTRDKNGVVPHIYKHLIRYSSETSSLLCPGERIHFIHPSGEFDVSEFVVAHGRFIKGFNDTFNSLPLWKIYRTESYRNLAEGHDVMNWFIDQKLKTPIDQWDNSYFKTLFTTASNLSYEEARALSCEIFVSGIETIAVTTSWTLFQLSKNKHCQDKLYGELANNNKSNRYLRGCIKESLRLSQMFGGPTRYLQNDVVMNGYNIPAGTLVVGYQAVTSVSEEYFKNAKIFNPERWTPDNQEGPVNAYSNYAFIPFGHGPRACPGQRIAEEAIANLVGKIIKEYSVDCDQDKIKKIVRLTTVPNEPINIKFTKRSAI